MKAIKLSLVIMVAAVLTIGLGGMAYAFHSGGVAECAGCHQMHSAPGPSLLIKSDSSSTCLSCHMHPGDTGPSSYHIMTANADMPAGIAPLQRGPGGDFGWLKKTFSWANREGGTDTETGDSHGHNIISADYGYAVDGTNGTAPGGAYNANNLSCVSCHNMHGSYRRLPDGTVSITGGPIIGSGSTGTIPLAGQAVGVYRLLWGGNAGFGANYPGVPAAVAPSSYNRSEVTQQTRVAYGKSAATGHTTWGQWCGTCHAGMLGGVGNHNHPVNQALSTTMAGNYTSYVSSGVMTGTFSGNQLNQGPFTSLVPFIKNEGNYATLKTYASSTGGVTPLAGPSSGDEVACLSCHRAHASGFKEMLRWNPETPFLTYVDSAGTVNWPGTDLPNPPSATTSMGRTTAETKAAYYDRNVLVFGAYQRSLCNKCHAKD
jgi:predicted CXXCH cytochrome family protein